MRFPLFLFEVGRTDNYKYVLSLLLFSLIRKAIYVMFSLNISRHCLKIQNKSNPNVYKEMQHQRKIANITLANSHISLMFCWQLTRHGRQSWCTSSTLDAYTKIYKYLCQIPTYWQPAHILNSLSLWALQIWVVNWKLYIDLFWLFANKCKMLFDDAIPGKIKPSAQHKV